MRFLHRLTLRAAATAWLLATSGVHAQNAAGEVESGRRLYMSNGCYSCHGTVGQGGERNAGPRIAPEPLPLEVFKVLVRHPKKAMPRFDARFVSDQQLQAIHSYLMSIPRGPAARDIPQLRAPS